MKYLFSLFLTFFLFVGCTPKPEPTLRLALVEWIGYAPLYVAEAKGWLPKNLRIIDFPSNYDIIEAMKLGNIEMAALTLDEVIILHPALPDLMIVSFLDASNGADALLAAPDIKRVEDLRNRRVAFEPKSVQAYLLDRALQLHGMSRRDIRPVLMKYDEQIEGWEKHRFDAVATFEPTKHRLVASGMHPLFDSGDIPGEIIDLLVTRQRILEEAPHTTDGVVQAWFRGVEALKSDPDAIGIVADYLHIAPAAAKNALKEVKLLDCGENLAYIDEQAARFSQIVSTVATILKDQGRIAHAPDAESLIDARWLTNACGDKKEMRKGRR